MLAELIAFSIVGVIFWIIKFIITWAMNYQDTAYEEMNEPSTENNERPEGQQKQTSKDSNASSARDQESK